MNDVLTYEVDQIRTVLPTDLDELQIVEDKDYCTLITCTPYGINTHRLLVRGHRIENVVGEIRVVSEAVLIDQLIVAVVLAIPILFVLFLMVMFKKPEGREAPAGAASGAAQKTRQPEASASPENEGRRIRDGRRTKVLSTDKTAKRTKH